MKNGSIQLMDLELEHILWKKRLELFINEVDLMVSQNNKLPIERKKDSLNPIELLALEEHKDNLVKLKSRIDIKEQELKFYNKDFPITFDHEYFKDHLELRQKNHQLQEIHLDRIRDIIKEIGI